MKGRYAILKREGEPAPYVKATLQLHLWNGAGGVTAKRTPKRREIARQTIRWVERELALWTAARQKEPS